MKLAFFGNVCNFAYWFAKWGRQLGYETYAIIEKNEKFPRDRPEWEDPEYDPSSPPDWVRFYNPGTPFDRAVRGFADRNLDRTLSEFDGIQTFSIATAVATHAMKRDFVHHTIGSFGRTATWTKFHTPRSMISPRRVPTTWRFRKAMNAAQRVVVSTAIEHFEVSNTSFGSKLIGIPIAYDATRAGAFSRCDSKKWTGEKLNFLIPARQHWSLKGQDTVLRAFASLSSVERKNVRVTLMDWGIDRERTKSLVEQLKLTELVHFSPILKKEDLWAACAADDTIVIDQFPHLNFHGGGIGGVARDAMAVGTPVITHADPRVQVNVHKVAPPVFHADSEPSAVSAQIRKCLNMNSTELAMCGQRSQEWIESECHFEKVLPRYIKTHQVEVLPVQ